MPQGCDGSKVPSPVAIIQEVVSSSRTPPETTLARKLHELSVPCEVLINFRRRSDGGAGHVSRVVLRIGGC
jgi:hypothetical protein